MGVYSLKNRTKRRRSSARRIRRRVVGGVRESPNNPDCPICFEDFVAGETPKKCNGCKYKYHEHCIRTWCARTPNQPCTCPNCRKEKAFSLPVRPPTPPARRPPTPPTRRRGRRARTPSPGRRPSPNRVTNDLIDVGTRRRRRRRTPSPPNNNNPYLRDFDGMM